MKTISYANGMKTLLLGSVTALIVSALIPSAASLQWLGLGVIFVSPILGSLVRSAEFVRHRQWHMLGVLLIIWTVFGVVAYFSLKKGPV